jgi:hypothetical protein
MKASRSWGDYEGRHIGIWRHIGDVFAFADCHAGKMGLGFRQANREEAETEEDQAMNAWTFIDISASVLTVAGAAWSYVSWYPAWKMAREQRQAAGEKAMSQIDALATNHLPHLQAEQERTNVHLAQQTAVLEEIKDSNVRTEAKFDTLIRFMRPPE